MILWFWNLHLCTILVRTWMESSQSGVRSSIYGYNRKCSIRQPLLVWQKQGCRIHRLHLCRRVRPPPHVCPGYDTKQSDGEVPVILGLWGIQSTLLLPLLPGPLWPGMVAPDKGPIYALNRTNWIFMLNWIRNFWLNWIAWNRNGFDK